MKAGINAETDGVILAEFISLGLQQGSFGLAFAEFVDDSSDPRKVYEKIKARLGGGKNKELIGRLQKYSAEVLQATANEVGTIAQQARSRGVDPAIYLGSSYDKDPDEHGAEGPSKIK
jgi:hypothetical protein